jgi:hypothetical protein
LQTSVAAWLDRDDLTTQVADFIALTEADIRNDLRVQAMEQYATGTLTGETLAHPTRYLEAKTLFVDDQTYQVVTANRYLDLGDSSEAKVYTSIGQSLYIKGTVSGLAYRLIYYQSFAAFSASTDTNWVLTNYPDVYLSGACRHAAKYVGDDANELRFAQRYAGSVARLKLAQMAASFPGPLVVRAA